VKSDVRAATILVVDDEPSVLQFAEKVLSGSGYRVLLAGDADAALRLFENAEAGICLVVSDITMPGINGVQLVETIRRISPATRALLLSGAADTEVDARLPFLRKPFTPHDLVAKVGEVSAGGAS
jgi:two-component system cell cycle sensor histidine kinase/response regulator CckA